MCLAAIYWARLDRLCFACTSADAAAAGFDDALFYQEIAKPVSQRAVSTGSLLRGEAWPRHAGMDRQARQNTLLTSTLARRAVDQQVTARFLLRREGATKEGCDAEFILFDPVRQTPVTVEKLHYCHKITSYLGRTLRGAVRRTILWEADGRGERPAPR